MCKRKIRKQRDYAYKNYFDEEKDGDWRPSFDLNQEESASETVENQPPVDAPKCRDCMLSPKMIRSFKALKRELVLSIADGSFIYLVPEYTKEAREEVSAEDMAFIIEASKSTGNSSVVSVKPFTPDENGESAIGEMA